MGTIYSQHGNSGENKSDIVLISLIGEEKYTLQSVFL